MLKPPAATWAHAGLGALLSYWLNGPCCLYLQVLPGMEQGAASFEEATLAKPLSLGKATKQDLLISSRLEQRMRELGSFETPDMCDSRKTVRRARTSRNSRIGLTHMTL